MKQILIMMVVCIVVYILFIPIAFFFMKKKAKKMEYKIGKITNNKGMVYYKIFAKKENGKEYKVLSEFDFFKFKKSMDGWSFDERCTTKEDAEEKLEDLLFRLKIKKCSQKIEIIN